MSEPHIAALRPSRAVAGGRVVIEGEGLLPDGSDGMLPGIRFGDRPARAVQMSRRSVEVLVPSGLEGGRTPVHIGNGHRAGAVFIDIGRVAATGLHQVDGPVVGLDGALYATYSGTRGERTPVSVFRIRQDGFREPFVKGIVNATSLAVAPDGRLFVSSRQDGTVYTVADDGAFHRFAGDLGIACGLAFSPDGTLYVGDRSGTVYRIGSSGRATPFATLPPSVAAFHLAWGPDDGLYVTGPTLATQDCVYRIDRTGAVDRIATGFGRPQGLSFDPRGRLHVVEALAGASAVYRLAEDGTRTRVLAAPDLVGVTFDRSGAMVAASGDTLYAW
ncbi:MAG: hypothetical protein F4Y45_12420 [Acidobacteria bacterium]|nr:hypothetical protein [Acidobacteriota bacterium]MYD70922.1 hypothetical protein [Acidobacteriota bacterium]MYJ05501.1 hypothetical protein [Acidobacteriota bacterium]